MFHVFRVMSVGTQRMCLLLHNACAWPEAACVLVVCLLFLQAWCEALYGHTQPLVTQLKGFEAALLLRGLAVIQVGCRGTRRQKF